MNSADVLSLIEDLEDGIEELEEDLEPILNDSLSTTTKKLPLLEKAKLYTLIVYAIESLLFSYLRLHGVAAKEHPVFKELTRVRQYFDKIKQAESGPPKPRENMSLNKEAAGRFIKAALAGNNKIDLELREKQAREALLAKMKLKQLEKKNKDASENPQAQPQSESHEQYLSEGEIEEDEMPARATINQPQPDQDLSEGEVEDEGKSQSHKRPKRKAKGEKSKQSPKSKRQKRKSVNQSRPSIQSQLPGHG